MRPPHGLRAIVPLIVLVLAGCQAAAPLPAGSARAGAGDPGTGQASAPPASAPPATARPRPTPTPAPPADVALETVATGLVAPLGLVTAPGDADGSFVVDQTGLVLVLRDGSLRPEPFLDIRDRLVRLDPAYDERGLLGLAFHPDYASNGRFFVYYSAPVREGAASGQDHTNTLEEYRAVAGEPDRADPASGRIVLQFEQPQPNHSGGGLGFGPDGLLYLGTGDGGGEGDASEGHSAEGNAQDADKLNGKILRLDVDGREPYAVPADNPYAGGGGRPEIYALGFRNPWRLTFEPGAGRRLLVSDVGYGRYEEVDLVVRGGNYGWRIREGAHCLDVDRPLADVTGCPEVDAAGAPLVDPVLEYTHDEVGIAVVGGYIYRGAALPALRGQYVFADFSADWRDRPVPRPTLLVASPTDAAGDPWPWRRLVVQELFSRFVSGMGEDAEGELYLLVRGGIGPDGTSGEIRRLVAPTR